MRRLFFSWFLLLLVAFTSACSNEQKDPIVFEGYGQHWKARINPEVQVINGIKKFTVTFQYLGSIQEINGIHKIVFAQGTRLGTEVVNVYDPIYKQQLLDKGEYKEEYEKTFGIIVETLTSRASTEFTLAYSFIEDGSTDLFEAVAIDGMNIQISWGHKDEENKDTIHIGGSMNPQVADTEVYP